MRFGRLILLLVTFVSVAAPAAAQEEVLPRLSVVVGYNFLRDPSWDTNMEWGWMTAVSFKIAERASVVAEGSGSYGEYGATRFTIERYGILGGIKIQGGGDGPRPFVQGLAGLSRQAGDVGVLNGFIFQPGGGIDLRIAERISVRGFGDYRLLREDGVFWHQWRFGGGVLIKIWK